MLLLLLAFVAGALTALAPCVLPLLPIIIGGSLSGEKQSKTRPYIIAASLATSLIVFTLLLKVTTLLIGVPPIVWIYLSGGIVIALGVTSLFPELWEQLVVRMGWQTGSQRFLGMGIRRKGILGPILIGAALGPVFSSCSPTYAFILATVLPRNFASGLIYLIVYCLGLVSVLLLIAVFGQRFVARFGWASNPHSVFRRALGVLFIVVGLSIIVGWDKQAETWLTLHSPINITSVDQKLFQDNTKRVQSNGANSQSVLDTSDPKLFNVRPTPAPEFVGLQTWINSNPLTLASLKGKVVLVDFWTYSCINCVRTLPYVEKWYETYKDKGFVVIGIQAPEFSFEKKESNVQAAVKQNGLTYPIALDNNLDTWNAFNNQYWPAHYLIDKNGIIRSQHFGEGEYNTTEQAIQKLLGESGPITSSTDNLSQNSNVTPETYFGVSRRQNYVQGNPSSLTTNTWSLSGNWQESADKITSGQDSSVMRFHVRAKDVYIVASTTDGLPKQISVNASNVAGSWYGKDDPAGLLTISGSSIYHLASFNTFQDSTLELKVPAGVSLYTFTFGS
jgi:cytochrome c biogenesis protein CcdA/thiol-disulfide isomerase/thioredoxin